MSRIVVFGVTGYAGGHITAELLDRGHTVVGVARGIAQAVARAGLELRAGSIYDPAFRTETVKGADAVVVALPAHPADGPDLDTIVSGLLDAVAGARLGIVGGAASLLATEGGPLVLDTLPEEYKPESEANARVDQQPWGGEEPQPAAPWAAPTRGRQPVSPAGPSTSRPKATRCADRS
jgi:uncharacterized protein